MIKKIVALVIIAALCVTMLCVAIPSSATSSVEYLIRGQKGETLAGGENDGLRGGIYAQYGNGTRGAWVDTTVTNQSLSVYQTYSDGIDLTGKVLVANIYVGGTIPTAAGSCLLLMLSSDTAGVSSWANAAFFKIPVFNLTAGWNTIVLDPHQQFRNVNVSADALGYNWTAGSFSASAVKNLGIRAASQYTDMVLAVGCVQVANRVAETDYLIAARNDETMTGGNHNGLHNFSDAMYYNYDCEDAPWLYDSRSAWLDSALNGGEISFRKGFSTPFDLTGKNLVLNLYVGSTIATSGYIVVDLTSNTAGDAATTNGVHYKIPVSPLSAGWNTIVLDLQHQQFSNDVFDDALGYNWTDSGFSVQNIKNLIIRMAGGTYTGMVLGLGSAYLTDPALEDDYLITARNGEARTGLASLKTGTAAYISYHDGLHPWLQETRGAYYDNQFSSGTVSFQKYLDASVDLSDAVLSAKFYLEGTIPTDRFIVVALNSNQESEVAYSAKVRFFKVPLTNVTANAWNTITLDPNHQESSPDLIDGAWGYNWDSADASFDVSQVRNVRIYLSGGPAAGFALGIGAMEIKQLNTPEPEPEPEPLEWSYHQESDPYLGFDGLWTSIQYSIFIDASAKRTASDLSKMSFSFTGTALQINSYTSPKQGSYRIVVTEQKTDLPVLDETKSLVSDYSGKMLGESPVGYCTADTFELDINTAYDVTVYSVGDGFFWIDGVAVQGTLAPLSGSSQKTLVVQEDQFIADVSSEWNQLSYYKLSDEKAVRTKVNGAKAYLSFTGTTAIDLISYLSPNYGTCNILLTDREGNVVESQRKIDLTQGVAEVDTNYQRSIFSKTGLDEKKTYTIAVENATDNKYCLIDALILKGTEPAVAHDYLITADESEVRTFAHVPNLLNKNWVGAADSSYLGEATANDCRTGAGVPAFENIHTNTQASLHTDSVSTAYGDGTRGAYYALNVAQSSNSIISKYWATAKDMTGKLMAVNLYIEKTDDAVGEIWINISSAAKVEFAWNIDMALRGVCIPVADLQNGWNQVLVDFSSNQKNGPVYGYSTAESLYYSDNGWYYVLNNPYFKLNAVKQLRMHTNNMTAETVTKLGFGTVELVEKASEYLISADSSEQMTFVHSNNVLNSMYIDNANNELGSTNVQYKGEATAADLPGGATWEWKHVNQAISLHTDATAIGYGDGTHGAYYVKNLQNSNGAFVSKYWANSKDINGKLMIVNLYINKADGATGEIWINLNSSATVEFAYEGTSMPLRSACIAVSALSNGWNQICIDFTSNETVGNVHGYSNEDTVTYSNTAKTYDPNHEQFVASAVKQLRVHVNNMTNVSKLGCGTIELVQK